MKTFQAIVLRLLSLQEGAADLHNKTQYKLCSGLNPATNKAAFWWSESNHWQAVSFATHSFTSHFHNTDLAFTYKKHLCIIVQLSMKLLPIFEVKIA
jgi:hypothetical protein